MPSPQPVLSCGTVVVSRLSCRSTFPTGKTNLLTWIGCWIGALLVLFFVPETRNLTLEELDQVFSVPTMRHAKYQLSGTVYVSSSKSTLTVSPTSPLTPYRCFSPVKRYAVRKYILRQRLPPRQPLYLWEDKVAVRY